MHSLDGSRGRLRQFSGGLGPLAAPRIFGGWRSGLWAALLVALVAGRGWCLAGGESEGGRSDVVSLYRKLLADAETQFKAGHYRVAWSSADTLTRARGPGGEAIHDAALALIDRLETRAAAIYEEGEKHWWYRQYEEAETQYRLLFQEFPKSRCFVPARNRLIALRYMPAVAAKKLLAAAQAKEDAHQYVEAVKRYLGVISQYPDTVSAVVAKKSLTALQSDPAKRHGAQAEVAELVARELDSKWRLAINYLGTVPKDEGDWVLYDRGVAYLHEIIALAPDSPQADKARARIRAEQERIEAEEKERAARRAAEQREKQAAEEKARQNR